MRTRPCLRAGVPAALLASLLPAASSAGALRPDPGFADRGVARVGFRLEPTEAVAPGLIATQPGGKLLAAGEILDEEGDPGSAVIARFDGHGRLDRSFGRGGKLRFYFPAASAGGPPDSEFRLSTIVVQPDAKIVLAGTLKAPCLRLGCPTDGRFALVRLTPNGRIDRSFGDHGFVDRMPTQLGSARGVVQAELGAVSLQADGGFLAGGFASEGGDPALPYGGKILKSRMVLMRFRADGTLDADFGRSGERRFDAGISWPAWEPVQARKLVAMGVHRPFPDAVATDGLEVIRFGAEGLPDQSFGLGGVALMDASGAGDLRRIASWPDGELLLSGGPGFGEGAQAVQLRRIRADGRPAPGFRVSCRPDPRDVYVTAAIPFGQGSLVSAVELGRRSPTRTFTRLLRYGEHGCLAPRPSGLRLEGYLQVLRRDRRGRVLLGGRTGHSLVIARLVRQRRR